MSGTKKRIVFISHWARQIGGAELSLLSLLAAAVKEFEAHLIVSEEGVVAERAMALGVICHIVPTPQSLGAFKRKRLWLTLFSQWRTALAFLRFVGSVGGVVRTIDPRLIHANVPKSHMVLLLLARFGYRGPCIIHMRELFASWSLPLLLYHLLVPVRRTLIIAVSHHVRNHLPDRLQWRTDVVHNGVEIPRMVIPKKLTSPLSLLYVGRVVPWKGCHLLIALVDMVRKRYPETGCVLTIAGDTSYYDPAYRQECERRIGQYGLGSSCRILPYTDDVAALYEAHHLFCTLAHNEPFGRSIAEAQGHGLPVVGFASGGVSEIVISSQTGIISRYGDLMGVADAVGLLWQNQPLYETMSRAARKRSAACFDSRIQADTVVAHIASVVRETGRNGYVSQRYR